MIEPTHDCLTCRKARWRRTQSGRLHNDGSGECLWKMPKIEVPAAFYWPKTGDRQPKPKALALDRRKPHQDCKAWESKRG